MKIAILGIGKLGSGFAEACCARGVNVTLWNRSQDKASVFAQKGARIADSAAEAIAAADVILSTLATGKVVLGVLGAADTKAALAGKTLICLTSTSSAEAGRLKSFFVESGGQAFLDVATTSFPAQIASGQGRILLGAAAEDVARYTELLKTFGTVSHVGGVGSASSLEMAFGLQLFIQQHMYLTACGIMKRAGLPLQPLMQVTEQNALYSSPLFKIYDGYVQSRTYTPAVMTIEHYCHALDMVIEELTTAGMDASVWLPVRKAAEQAEKSHGPDADWTSIYETMI